MKILITGASGFVGQFLLEKLVEESDKDIIALHNRKLPEALFKRYGDRVNWIQCDLTNDSLSQVLVDVDVVYHLAGASANGASIKERQLMNKANVYATSRLAKECLFSRVDHFIFVSSIAACESSLSNNIDETNGYPITFYGKSKKKAEQILINVAKNHFNITILRPTALFGEMHEGSIFELTKNIYKKRFVIFGSGDNLTNFYYIRDFIDLLVLVQKNTRAYNQIFIASDQPYKLNTLASWIYDSLKCTHHILRVPMWIGYIVGIMFDSISYVTNRSLPFSLRRLRSMTKNVRYSNAKLNSAIKFNQRYGVRDGLVKTIRWFRDIGSI